MKGDEVLHAISAMMPEERCCWLDDAMRAGGDCVRQGTRVWRVEGLPVVPLHAGGPQGAGGSQGAWNGGEWFPSRMRGGSGRGYPSSESKISILAITSLHTTAVSIV